MSKILSAVIILLILSTPIFSQGFQNVLKDSVIYLTPEEEAFMIDKKSTYLFKLYPYSSSLANVVNRQSLSFAFEKKLSKAFSVSLLADFPQAVDLSNPFNGEVSENTFWRGGVEMRYYYQMPSLIEKGKQANNLSGNYFGVKLERGWFTGESSVKTQETHFYNISYGIQKRFLNKGFVDFSINLGSARYLRANTTRLGNRLNYENHFFLSAGIRAGVAFGKNYELTDNLVCPIFKCHTDRKSALKINMVKLWSVGFSDFLGGGNRNQLYINLSPNVSYEIKLAKSPLSFEQDLDAHLYLSGNRTLVDSGFGLNTYHINYHAGFRYYHGMRNRIKKGQSGNNLSGAYSFARVSLEQYSSLDFVQGLQTDIYLLQRNINKGVALQAGIGYQKAVLERLYFDVGMGARKDIKLNLNRPLTGIRLDIYTKVGWMF